MNCIVSTSLLSYYLKMVQSVIHLEACEGKETALLYGINLLIQLFRTPVKKIEKTH